MYVDDAFDLGHGGTDLAEVEVFGRAFEQDVQRFAHDAGGAPQDHAGNNERQDRVDPLPAGDRDAEAADDDGGG